MCVRRANCNDNILWVSVHIISSFGHDVGSGKRLPEVHSYQSRKDDLQLKHLYFVSSSFLKVSEILDCPFLYSIKQKYHAKHDS